MRVQTAQYNRHLMLYYLGKVYGNAMNLPQIDRLGKS